MRALFICSHNIMRSATAEAVFADYPGLQVDSAGTESDAKTRVSADAVEWADIIFVMETFHLERLQKMFAKLLRDKHVVVLDVPDEYDFMDPELIELLKREVEPHLGDF
jgi:predicted protein tyrosine phosphatase